MAECFINKEDISSQVQLFSELYAEAYDKIVQDSAGAMTQTERQKNMLMTDLAAKYTKIKVNKNSTIIETDMDNSFI